MDTLVRNTCEQGISGHDAKEFFVTSNVAFTERDVAADIEKNQGTVDLTS